MSGSDFSIVGDTVTMKMDFMDRLIEKVSGVAADRAVEKYQEEKMREEKLTCKEASMKLGVSKSTIIRYLTTGKKKGGISIKLKGLKTGRDYIISRFDLEDFKNKIEA